MDCNRTFKLITQSISFLQTKVDVKQIKKNDCNVGKTRHMVARGTIPQIMCSVSGHQFNILPFTLASGKTVCCVLISVTKVTDGVLLLWKTGIDITIKNPVRNKDNKIDYEMNVGEGKYYPGGPKCKFNSKVVECLTFGSESGGITGEILVGILQYFDEIDLFPRQRDGPIPMLIVDGHQSRLDPSFVEYINDHQHKWKVSFGVPYATNIWQVGDASEQNGKFETEWYKKKHN